MISAGSNPVRYSGPYPESDPLAHSLDDAIAEANKIAEARAQHPDEVAKREADAARWAAIRAAQDAAGPHAVVLPIAVARDAISYLTESDEDPLLSPQLVAELIEVSFPDRLT